MISTHHTLLNRVSPPSQRRQSPIPIPIRIPAIRNPESEIPNPLMNYREIITAEPGKRSGKPCIRGMRITVQDVLEYLAGGMTHREIIDEFPELTENDIRAVLAFTQK